jgi:hypothetical protein
MSEHTQLPGELLYEYTPTITQVVGYGVPTRTGVAASRGSALRRLLRRPC